jgi:hypothetical protein
VALYWQSTTTPCSVQVFVYEQLVGPKQVPSQLIPPEPHENNSLFLFVLGCMPMRPSPIRAVVPAGHEAVAVQFADAQEPDTMITGFTFWPVSIPFFEPDGTQILDEYEPLGARRIRVDPDGTVTMMHQATRSGEIPIPKERELIHPTGRGTPYGGGTSAACRPVASTAMTQFDRDGNVMTTAVVTGVTLAVDFAVARGSRDIAFVSAGAADAFGPSVVVTEPNDTLPMIDDPRLSSTQIQETAAFSFFVAQGGLPNRTDANSINCFGANVVIGLTAPATAVTFLSDGRWLVQSREPARLHIVGPIDLPNEIKVVEIEIGGASVFDTGHEIFHRDPGGGIACATCHLEGEEDGHTWRFVGEGPRRTQALSIGLEGTAPFHWIGDMSDLGKLMETIFVARMGGVHQSPERLDALARWMNSIQPRPLLRAATDPAVARGRDLFVGAAECSQCHDGPKFTNNQTIDVGTGLALQVPSLIGIGHRGPWLHTGCAKTLQQRFDPECGGSEHGNIAVLSSAQIEDLAAYLESL